MLPSEKMLFLSMRMVIIILQSEMPHFEKTFQEVIIWGLVIWQMSPLDDWIMLLQ
jgi:hypothetical protein